MTIEFKNYKIKQNDGRFDLIKTRTAKKESGETYEKDEIIAHSVSIGYAINNIAGYILEDREETVDLKTFLSEYEKIKNQLTGVLKN